MTKEERDYVIRKGATLYELIDRIEKQEISRIRTELGALTDYVCQAERNKKQKPCGSCEYHDWEWDDHIGFRDICKGIGRCPYNVEETVTSEPIGTRQCEKCKWHFTDGNESYCQRDYHDLPCIYEECK